VISSARQGDIGLATRDLKWMGSSLTDAVRGDRRVLRSADGRFTIIEVPGPPTAWKLLDGDAWAGTYDSLHEAKREARFRARH